MANERDAKCEDPSWSDSDERLDEAIAAYLLAAEAGQSHDRDQWLARYPDLAADLEKFLADQEQVEHVAKGLRSKSGAEGSGKARRRRYDSLEPAHLTGGTVLGDFHIVREVGRGGMGTVYEATQISLGRRVALKVLPYMGIMDPRRLQRFRHEAQAAALLHHTNIVPIFFVGDERGVHYYAMQFIDGQNLADVIAGLQQTELLQPDTDQTVSEIDAGEYAAVLDSLQATRETHHPPCEHPKAAADFEPLKDTARHGLTRTATLGSHTSRQRTRQHRFRTVAQLGVQIAEALDYAHQQGIIHRDIKPANLMLDRTGHLWVTDFGLARLQSDSGLTMTGDMMGTLRYMSLEQALGKRAIVDQRTDIYSLGATLYELLTLQPALAGDDRQELLRQIAFEDPKPLRRIDPSIPVELEIIVLKAMAKEPSERYGTAGELADDLRRFLDHRPIFAKPPSLADRARKWMRRNRPLATGVALSLTVLLVGLVFGVVAYGLAQQKLATDQFQLAKDREQARAETAQELYGTLLRQAASLRTARQPGYRNEVWKNLHEAIALDVPAKNMAAVQDEVMACLADPIGLESVPEPQVERAAPASVPEAFNEMDLSFSVRAASPDGKLLAYVSSLRSFDDAEELGKTIVVIDRDAHTRHSEDAGVATIRDITFSRDGRRLALAGSRGIVVYDVPSFIRLAVLRRTDITSVAIHPDNGMLLSMTPRQIHLWNLNYTDSVLLADSAVIGAPYTAETVGVDFSADGKMALVVSRSGKASHGWFVEDTPEHQNLAVLSGGIPGLAFSPDGKLLASVSKDHLVRLWDTSTANLTRTCVGHEYAVQALAFSPDGRWLATADFGGGVCLWNPDTGDKLAQVVSHIGGANELWRIRFHPSGRLLIAAGDAGIEGWTLRQTADGVELDWLLTLALPSTRDFAFHPNGTDILFKRRFSETGDGQLVAYDLRQAKLRLVDRGEPGRHILQMEFDPSGESFIHQGQHGNVAIKWPVDPKVGLERTEYSKVMWLNAISTDGRWGVGGGQDGIFGPVARGSAVSGELGLFDFKARRGILRLASRYPHLWSAAISPDGTRLALGYPDGPLAMWNLEQVRARLAEFGIAMPSTRIETKVESAFPALSNEELERLIALNRVQAGKAVESFYQSIEHVVVDSYKSLEPANDDPAALNQAAWELITSPYAAARDPARAVKLARRAAELAPEDGSIWNTLGVAEYRAGNWNEAAAALEQSLNLRGPNALDQFFLAMARWQLGEEKEALTLYDRAVREADSRPNSNEDLSRVPPELIKIRIECEAVLGSAATSGRCNRSEPSTAD